MTELPLVNTLTTLVEPLAHSLGLSLWGIETAFGGQSVIRIYVEGDNGVTIDQCAELSRLLSLTLDVEDILPGSYMLEVSSPGLERVFFTPQQLCTAAGKPVEVVFPHPNKEFSGRKKFRGLLELAPADKGLPDGRFLLQVEDPSRPGMTEGVLHFSFEEIKKAKLLLVIPEKELPGKGKKKPKEPCAAADNTIEHTEAE